VRPVNYIPGHVYGASRPSNEGKSSKLRSIQISGKGILVEYLFQVIVKIYHPDAVWTQAKRKWYQQQDRHFLRIDNLTPQQIGDLGDKIHDIGVSVVLTLVDSTQPA
jgi:hypothetical protein